ncbi:riboflavin biosynthesis protein RibD [Iodidimonas nitroreducens]|uniref:Riboflavin biosynthesis protein RibD n=2 Tax=Iodidimonas nitroreducens TaxID=1236968 RepID=A0A5A7NDA9_9PROT|nr:bifunctional diaminohydroxyphosphoribosylaminopyrimidine deaminase/5-amino-6-(5-phosphoribosylamino)uracil reductase RibD [Iodidimonas nitroreducens]GAK33353.1 riboflavin biosynthesis protein RibD [alpha proteobacterium Q-1]GER05615.1 riboflavin biosynthesis protein RibD [Iodidimonas nitroreducens]
MTVRTHFMDMALRLGRRGLGRVAPNPAVGCVLVKEDRIIGRGWTQPGGRPHAETQALQSAVENMAGATAYVSLEPCAHQGATPSCATALIDAGIARVVVAMEDPDPRTAGQGVARMRAAGLQVDLGILAEQAQRDHQGFVLRLTRDRPLVSGKIAHSADGRIASATGHSQWITGSLARAHGHALRAHHDAILIGGGTWRADHPRLDCRLPGLADRSPQKVLLSHGVPEDQPDGWWTSAGLLPDHQPPYDLDDLLAALARRGITRLLVEGGAATIAAFMRVGLMDRLYLYTAPKLIGEDGRASVGALGVRDVMADAPYLKVIETRTLGEDALAVYERG